MWDAIGQVLTSENGLIVTLLGLAWRYFAGDQRKALERRIREAAEAAWHVAKATTGLTGDALRYEAHKRAEARLAKLGHPALTGELLELLDHELERLDAHDLADATARLAATLPDDQAEADSRIARLRSER